MYSENFVNMPIDELAERARLRVVKHYSLKRYRRQLLDTNQRNLRMHYIWLITASPGQILRTVRP